MAVRLASALAINKLLAIYVGASGYALIGQLQSAASFAAGLAGGVLGNGLVKGTAEHFDDLERQRACWKSAFRVALWSTLAVGCSLVLAREPLSAWLLAREDFSDVFVWLALALPAITANSLLLAVLNGKGAIGAFVGASIAGNLLAFGATAGLTVFLGLHGALIAAAAAPALSILASTALASRARWFHIGDFWGSAQRRPLVELSKFALMGLSTAICVPVAHMLIRNHLGESFGWAAAGHWQAVYKVSEIYLMLITLTLGTYYLPKIAAISSAAEMRAELAKAYRFAIPLAATAAATIYVARDLLVPLLFAPDFAPMTELFAWQLAGDVVKVASWILGYVLIGRAAAAAFIGTELLFSALLVVLTCLLTGWLGLKGAPAAYFLTYALYFATLAVVVKRMMRSLRAGA